MTTELLALADRVEAAKAWNIALDEAVAVAIGWQRPMLPGICGPNYEGRNRYEWHDAAQQPRGFYPPQFTASLDAAVTLVPEGYDWGIAYFGPRGSEAQAWPRGARNSDNKVIGSSDVSVAASLTAAALRARASNTTAGDGSELS